MRVLCIHRYSHRKGGAEAVFLDHVELLESNGWTCAQYVMAHPENQFSRWENYFPSYFNVADRSLSPLRRLTRSIYSVEAKRNLDRLLDDFRPDIVHLHGAYYQLTMSILEPISRRKIPLVFTAHDFKLMCPAYFFFSPNLGICERCASGNTISCVKYRCIHNSYAASIAYAVEGAAQRISRAYERAVSAYVMPSRFILEKFAEYGFAKDKLHYIPNFFESTSDVIVTPEDIAQTHDELGAYVLFFGRLSPEKGVKDLIQACHRSSLPLVVVGDGPEEERLKEVGRQLGANIKFLGHLRGHRLWTVVESARCVALPSIWYENAPKSILEAQARKRIVVGANVGGIPEMIQNGISGYLFEKGDVEQLALKLRIAFDAGSHPDNEIGLAAQAHALNTFTRDRYFNEMSDLYGRLLGR